ncbi:MAG: leucyl aminopeptidase [Myxococcota bacterium]
MNIRFASESLADIAADVLVVGTGPGLDGALATLDAKFDGKLVAELKSRKFKGGEGSAFVLPTLGRLAARELVIVGVGDGGWPAMRVAAGKAGREIRALNGQTAVLAFPGVHGAMAGRLLEAAAAGNYLYQAYKPEEERSSAVSNWVVTAAADEQAARAAGVRNKWQQWARDLVNAPAADVYPESLAGRARELGAIPGVTVEVWDVERCKAEGCVGIVAVGQGSTRPGCMIQVRYRPADARDHVALVGKGVTFDSGGLSLKPSDSMQTMRCDMGGAATMLATVGIVAELGLPIAVDVWVPAVENMNSGSSYKLGDVLRYPNGVTVEIHNTDAEGRLVLADGLIRACRTPGVRTVVDAATLTGACVVALGDDYTGLFTDDAGLADELSRAAEHTGEGLWRMPLHGPYKELMKSEFAQIKNVGGRAAGAVTAALFLQYFVSGPRWAHLDIAGPAFLEKASNRYAAGGTGEMVRTLATWIEGCAAR